MIFQVYLTALQPMPLISKMKTYSCFGNATRDYHRLSLSLYHLVNRVDYGRSLSIGKRKLFWISNVTIVNVHGSLGSWSSNQICFTSAPNHCWFSSIKQIGKIIKGHVMVRHIVFLKELTMWLRKWLKNLVNNQLPRDFDTQQGLSDLELFKNLWVRENNWRRWRNWSVISMIQSRDIIFIRKACSKGFGMIIDV